ILKPSDGRPVAEPSQDIVLGCYFLTKAPADFDAKLKNAPRISTVAEAEDARGKRWENTTIGRVLFNSIVPAALGYQNREMKKKVLGELVFEAYRQEG